MMTTAPTPTDETSLAFGSFAPQLADWASRIIVNRSDVYGQYASFESRESGPKSFMRPEEGRRLDGALTQALLERHFVGSDVGHLLGIHAISRNNRSRWIAVDVDQHNEASIGSPPNQRAAQEWYQRLRDLGFAPLLIDSNGNGGFHLWVFFNEPIPSNRAFSFARWLVKDFASFELSSAPETFPKQPRLSEQVPYGSWLRLPGRHHTRDHWPRIWDGTWRSGGEVVERLLSFAGDNPNRLPKEALEFASDNSVAAISEVGAKTTSEFVGLLDGVREGGRHNALVRLVGHYREHGLPEDEIVKLMLLWDSKNVPPLGDKYIRSQVSDVMTRYGLPRQYRKQSNVLKYSL